MENALLMRVMLRLVRGDTERALLEVTGYPMAESRILERRYEKDAASGCCSVTSNAGSWPRWLAP